jgi:molecular chaperone HtpG
MSAKIGGHMAENKPFKAESQRLLDLMINSIYTNKDIFLRELISNASDACDKLYFASLEDDSISIDRTKLHIEVSVDKEARTVTIKDNGIGMDLSDMEDNLGTIAKSGSLAFKQALEKGVNDVEIIGQFGVGFYSAFMVSDKVTVISKKINSDKSFIFESAGVDGYFVDEADKEDVGTIITCHIKENIEDEDFDRFLETYNVRSLIKQYSDYIRYPIMMKKDDEEEVETLNSMIPLWKRSKSDITQDEYNSFYKDKFYDFEDPAKVIHMNVEGNLSFTALMYIPKKAPFNFYSNEFEKGLQLYSKGVFIMDKAKDLLGDHFRFVRGLVDSPDLNLNISREILQQDRQLKSIAQRLEKKIKSELISLLTSDRESYETFYQAFGNQLKYGLYQSYGMNKELLIDLVLFYSSHEKKFVTLAEYVTRMKDDQKEIYFISANTIEQADRLPASERVKDKGYEILYLVDDIDEFVLQMVRDYQEKPFKSINQGDLDLSDETEKEAIKDASEKSKDVLEALKEKLKDKVEDVRLSSRLKSHPVCLVSTEGVSFEMEKVLSQMPDAKDQNIKAKRILELNPDHPLLVTLTRLYENKSSVLDDVADVLYDQACLIEGLPIEDPVGFALKLSNLLTQVQ